MNYKEPINSIPIIKIFIRAMEVNFEGKAVGHRYGLRCRYVKLRAVTMYTLYKFTGCTFEELAHMFNVSRFTTYQTISRYQAAIERGYKIELNNYDQAIKVFIKSYNHTGSE